MPDLVIDGSKQCSRCKRWKSRSEFGVRGEDHSRLRSACRKCDADVTNRNKSKLAAARLAALPPPKDESWNPKEMSRLLELHGQGFSPGQIGTLMGMKARRVRRKLFVLKLLKPQRVWSATEDQLIRTYYEAAANGLLDLGALAKALSRTKALTCRRARELGLTDPNNPGKGRQNGRSNSGKREDLADLFFRSSWEANYARYLNLLKAQGKIRDWDFEQVRWIFEEIARGTRSYLCDFRVFGIDGSIEFHEVKGWMSPPARTAITRMALYYPEVDLRVIDESAYRNIAQSVGKSIPAWEWGGSHGY